MVSISTNVLGVFAVKNHKIIGKRRFPDEAGKVSEILAETKSGVSPVELELILSLIDTGVKDFLVDDPNRFWGLGLNASFQKDEQSMDVFSIAEDVGVDKKVVQDLIYSVNLEASRQGLSEPERDQLLVQAVNCLDDLDDALNKLSERLREWYSLHFPELDYLVSNHETYALVVSKAGRRQDLADVKVGLDSDHFKKITEVSADSFGFDLSDKDAQMLKSLAGQINELFQTKKEAEEYVEELMKEVAPNICGLVGAQLGARIIAKSGSLKRLSRMPAGTIQVLGAEDAFFRFLKSGKKPPKHGMIFMHPDIRSAPKSVRGKLSRSLAAKLAIASRADSFRGGYVGDKLREQFQERVAMLKGK